MKQLKQFCVNTDIPSISDNTAMWKMESQNQVDGNKPGDGEK